jgi:ABC-type transporter lipoprotein component MlaA
MIAAAMNLKVPSRATRPHVTPPAIPWSRPIRPPAGLLPRLQRGALFFGLLILPGCALPVQRHDWSDYTGPGAAEFRKPEYELPFQDDPLEPFNRVMLGANHLAVAYIVRPLSTAWRFLVAQVVRDHLNNAADNLGYPGRAVNNMLQGRFQEAGDETKRFLVNTTVGVLGLFDPASAWGIPRAPTDTGLTFGVWGWRDSTYLGLPVVGRSTVRDGLGWIGDTVLDPCTYFFPAGPIRSFIVGSESVEDYMRVVQTNEDPYAPGRMLWFASRQILDTHFEWGEPGDGADQTVRAGFLSCRDPWFPMRARTHAVEIAATGRDLQYELWLQPEPAPLVYILPGLGTHRRSGQALAMAELVFDGGFSVVTISSAMNFDFMEHASTVPLPGYAPTDARNVHAALDAIDGDLARRCPGRITSRSLLGLSLGGFHALLIAAGSDSTAELVSFERLVAVNPPVSMSHAVERLDAFYNTPLELEPEPRDTWVRQTMQKAAAAYARGNHDRIALRSRGATLAGAPPSGSEVHFTRPEAEFLIGVSFRLQLLDVIWVSQERNDMGVLRTPRRPLQRAPAAREILEYSYAEYFYAFVFPWFLGVSPPGVSQEQIFAALDLRSIAEPLRINPKARLISNENDFLLRQEDIDWLTATLGEERVRFFPGGGHLGNLDDPTFREAILQALQAPDNPE